ncbi:response regulator transcription factor [Streptomyces sp. NPDC101393]|uniref:response regulator transcription factor n=1 Tax=Streptomyces sp. NPDC101393 TaxID=3366141 RepID=UPI00381DDCEA
MRILLVEDDTGVRELPAQGLTSLHHEVITAASGSTGLDSALTRDPDLVVLDLGLPDLDGLTVLKMLRTVTSVPIVAATGRDTESQVIRGLEAGADDYVVKPFTAALLHARLNAVMRQRRGRRRRTTCGWEGWRWISGGRPPP